MTGEELEEEVEERLEERLEEKRYWGRDRKRNWMKDS